MTSSIGLLRRARILDLITGVPGEPTDLHIVDGRISRQPVHVFGGGGEHLDLEGRIVLPGLWDAHVHLNQWAQSSRWIDVSQTTDPRSAASVMAAADTRRPGTDLLVGFGFRDSRWPVAPAAADLDEVGLTRPVAVFSGDFHSMWLNSAALSHFGIDAESDGLLREEEAFAVHRRLASEADENLDDWVAEAARNAAALGLVGVVDMEMHWAPPVWQRRHADGFDALRVRAAVYPQWLDQALAEGLKSRDPIVPEAAGRFTQGPLKVISDGSLTARTAFCHHPYPTTGIGDPVPGHGHGISNIDFGELSHLMSLAWAGGIESAIHAIGDRAVSQAIDAFAESGAGGSIEHAQLISADDIARMRELAIRASVQPAHLLDDAETMDTLWAGQQHNAFPLASMLDAGVQVAFGSDAPISPLNPWLAIQSAVNRSWHPEQAVSLSQALLASARGVSALVPGAGADLFVLEENPFETPVDQLAGLSSSLTLIEGRVTHNAL